MKLASFLLTLALAACGSSATQEAEEVQQRIPRPARARPPMPEPIYGPDGALLPSTLNVAGLVLPRGLEQTRNEERRHVYRTDARPAKVQQYFGRRLLTGEVEELGGGAVYRHAVPRGVRGGLVKMDVSIIPGSSGQTRVEIVELPPPPASPVSEDEVRERLRADSAHWD